MASAAAGSANIMIGKKPDWNWPAVGSPARKRGMSPCTMEPSGLVNSPNWNQTKVFSSWCMPISSSARLNRPKMPAPPAPRSARFCEKSLRPRPIGGQTQSARQAVSMPTRAVIIGTRRRPLKKPSQSTSLVRWNRTHSQADIRPIRIPPSTPGFWYVALAAFAEE